MHQEIQVCSGVQRAPASSASPLRALACSSMTPAGAFTSAIEDVRPGRQLNVVRFTVPDARTTLFFVHGGRMEQYRFLFEKLKQQKEFNVVGLDFLGHGQSPTPEDWAHWSSYSGKEFVLDIDAIYAKYRTERNYVIAHSYGTTLTLQFAAPLLAKGDKSLKGLILIGAVNRPPPSAGPLFFLPVWVLEYMRPILSASFVQRAWHRNTDKALIEEERARSDRNSLYRPLVRQFSVHTEDTLNHIIVPVLLLSGRADALTSPSEAEQLKNALRNARHIIYENAGHMAMLEVPTDLFNDIQNFLRETEKE